MVLNGIGASAGRRPSSMSRSAEGQADAPADALEHRALVPVREIDPGASPSPYSRRPAAPFLAQLIATARGEAQTRELRRAEPEAAAQAYAAAAERAGGAIFPKS